jgi:hypothetical protein
MGDKGNKRANKRYQGANRAEFESLCFNKDLLAHNLQIGACPFFANANDRRQTDQM